jgi:hypothetical protein
MATMAVTEDAFYIRVLIAGDNSEPMRENTRQAEANRAARKFKGARVVCISSGGAFTGNGWELNYTFALAGRNT